MLHESVQRRRHATRPDDQSNGRSEHRVEQLLQRAMSDPDRLSPSDLPGLQRIVGNTSVQRLLAGSAQPTVQREDGDDDESFDLNELFKSDEEKEADRAKGTYETMAPGMDQYAKRTAPDSLTGKAKSGTLSGYSKALSLPRNPDGSLSPEAISIMNEEQAKESQSYIDTAAKAGFKGAPVDKAGLRALKKSMKGKKVGPLDADLNPVSGKSRMPEMANLTDPKVDKALAAYQGATGKGDASVVSSIQMSGVNLLVNHSMSDVNFAPRLKMFGSAIDKIQTAGFKLPETLLVHLPKFGRSIDVAKQCAVGDSTPRAVFNPPNFIHLSSAVVGNPNDKKMGANFEQLSVSLDPSGAGTVIHEMGHLMHFMSSASNFYSLQSASHKTPQVAAKVSSYATNNPREFVAEVFLGLVFGKTFDDDVIQMYSAFGGPMSDRITAQIAAGRGGQPGGGGAV